jgi:predicted amidophosphoribosyltransferase
MSNGCPNCEALCTICQDNTYNWHEPLCSSCRLAVAHTEDRIIELLEDYDFSTIWRQVAWNPHAWEGFGSGDLIALIKGEK